MLPKEYTSLANKPIWLTGYMGCGKSTLAPLLANSLNLPWLDTDALLTEEFGCSISEVFQTQGEAVFRSAEEALLSKLCAQGMKPHVIATGGGFLATPNAMKQAKASGVVIYLQVPVAQLWQRIHAEAPPHLSKQPLASRPLVSTSTQQQFDAFQERFKNRQPVYETAHLIFNASEGSPAFLLKDLIRQLEGLKLTNHF